jgi:hypothetical protein
VRIDSAKAAERHREPRAVDLLPEVRRSPLPRARDAEAVRQPQLRAQIAVVLDERDDLAVGDGAVSDRERFEEHAMARPLVVEREALAVVSDAHDATLVRDETHRPGID